MHPKYELESPWPLAPRAASVRAGDRRSQLGRVVCLLRYFVHG